MPSEAGPQAAARRRIHPTVRCGGQAIVEFGLIALTLVFLIGAGVDLGLMVTVRQSVTVITGEAARQVAYGAPVVDVFDAADRASTGTLANTSGLMLSLRYCATDGSSCHAYCNSRFLALAADPVRPNPCGPPPPKGADPASRLERPGDVATLNVWEEKYEILTPWIRAWASLPSSKDDLCVSSGPCYMRLTGSEQVVYPGPARPGP